MALYLLTEDGGRILLEDNTGALLLEDPPEYWTGDVEMKHGQIEPSSYQHPHPRFQKVW